MTSLNSLRAEIRRIAKERQIGSLSLVMPDGTRKRMRAGGAYLVTLFDEAARAAHAKITGQPVPDLEHRRELDLLARCQSKDPMVQTIQSVLETAGLR